MPYTRVSFFPCPSALRSFFFSLFFSLEILSADVNFRLPPNLPALFKWFNLFLFFVSPSYHLTSGIFDFSRHFFLFLFGFEEDGSFDERFEQAALPFSPPTPP